MKPANRPSLFSDRVSMRCSILFCAVVGITWLTCQAGQAAQTPAAVKEDPLKADLRSLLAATRNPESARALSQQALASATLPNDDPLWPAAAFLRGEAQRLRGESAEARRIYRSLAEWAAADPYRDTWGGSGLATVALWRWAQLFRLETAAAPDEAEALLQTGETLKQTRFMKYMFHTPLTVIGTLPQLEEDILRLMALIAATAGKKTQAQQLFLAYLAIATTTELTPAETELLKQISAAGGLASPDRLALLRGKRLLTGKRYPEALNLLKQAQASDDGQIRAEAGFYLARLQRYQGASREQILELLDQALKDAAKPEIIQMALLERAAVSIREGPGKDEAAFVAALTRLITEFPRGQLADEALYQLAKHFEYAGDLPQALAYYAQLRKFEGENHWLNLAFFEPAIALYRRGQPTDRKNAAALLQELEKLLPDGPLHLANVFWLGRMAEEAGDSAAATACFQKIIAAAPYNYYALRARLHLAGGNRAKEQLWPGAALQKELLTAYQQGQLPTNAQFDSSYHQRLRRVLETGVYAQVFTADHRLREKFPMQRQDDLSLADLDQEGILTQLSLLLAFRQDALAARDRAAQTPNRLQLVEAIEQAAGDWPLAMNFVLAVGEPPGKEAALQQDSRYLAVAYPPIFAPEIKQAGAQYHIPSALIYSIMRRESLFYPAAFSAYGALGLFQFIPNTFASLDKRWGLLKNSGAHSRAEFLLAPKLSIALGARWLQEELLARYQGQWPNEILFPLAVMTHNAGYPAVREWLKHWQQEGRATDLEYMLETIPYRETSWFTKRVLTDMIIVDASGILN